MAQRIPVEVLDNDRLEMQKPARMGKAARIQSQVAVNRVEAIKRITATATTSIADVYGVAAEATEMGLHRLDRQDTAMARLGEEAAREHQIAKENLSRRHQQIAELAAGALSELYQRDLEDVFCQPDGAFYQPTTREQLSAWFWDGASIELQLRNLGSLTPREKLKELIVGGVTDAKVAAYDHRQIAERRDRFELRKQLNIVHAQLAQLMDRNAELELAVGEAVADETYDSNDDDLTAKIDEVEELLRQVRAPR